MGDKKLFSNFGINTRCYENNGENV